MDEKARRLHEELQEVFRNNPLERYNNPLLPRVHKKQLEFHAIQPPPLGIKGAIAGNRCGKTIGCIVDDIIQLVPRELVPPHLVAYKKWDPPFHVWIGAPKLAKHEDTILPLLRKFLPKAALPEGQFGKAYRSQSRMVELPCGSTVGLKTYDQDLDAWASAEVHRIHWDEEPNIPHSAELRSEARARLLSTGGEEIIGMSPLLGYSWVYDDVWLRRDQPNVSVVQMEMSDNPWLTAEMIAKFEAGLTEDEKRMRVKGEFVHVGGLVYPQLRDRHYVDAPQRDHLKGQSIYVGIDPGINTTAVIFVAFDSDNCALVFDELFLHNNDAIPERAAKAIREKLSLWDIDPRHYLIDPSARNRSLTDAQRVQELYKYAGIRTRPAQNDRETGVFEVRRRLEFDQILISRDCRHLRWELERYRQQPTSDGRFDVLKEDDHGCFVGETLIETERGEVPIEKVTLADRVLTREGYHPVEHLAQTQASAAVYRLVYDGGELVGTGDHPVWVDGGFRRLDALRYGDILTPCPKPLNTTGTSGVATQSQRTSLTGATSDAPDAGTSTAGSGRSITAPSRAAARSTTLTEIPGTTPSKIWPAFLRRNTRRSIGPRRWPRPRGIGLLKQASWLQSGTARPRGGSGTASTAVKRGKAGSLWRRLVSSAARPIDPWTPVASAPTAASLPGAAQAESMTRTEPAPSAERHSAPTGTHAPRPVRVLAVQRLQAPRAVYNLTVNGPSEYFANGVLVSNCDALRYVCMARPLPISVRPQTRRERELYVPGTAPAGRPPKRQPVGPLGAYS